MPEYTDYAIDPTLASMDEEFLGNLALQNTGIYSPYALGALGQQSQGQPKGSLFNDPTLSLAISSLDSVSKEISRLTETIRTFAGNVSQFTNRTDSSINSLVQLQTQTQMQISRNQISQQYAQVINPNAFGAAPGLEYQIGPSNAIFRNQIGAAMPRLAERPTPSFFSDLLMSQSWYRRRFYEPSFSEDPYMATLNADVRMSERMLSAGNTAGTIGTQIGAGIASWGLAKGLGTKLATSALTKIGIGTAMAPGIGTAFAIGDIALEMLGLPSISGAIGNTAEAIYGATAGRYFTNIDMARDVQRATRFYTGTGDSATGQGLGLGRAGKVISGLQRMQAQDYALNMKDYMGIFTEAANQGLFSMAGNEEDMLRNVKGISKNLRLFMRISGDPDYKNAIKSMGDLFRMGIPVENLGAAVTNIANFSRMAGISYQQASTFGAQGAMVYQQAGANIGLGYQTGVQSRALARLAVQGGQMSPGVLAQLGGEEGLSQRMTEVSGAFMGGPMGQVLLAGFLKTDAGGNLTVDREFVKRATTTGNVSMGDIMRRASALPPSLGAQFVEKRLDLQTALSEQMGTGGQLLMITKFIQEIQRRGPSGMTFGQAAVAAFGGDVAQARAVTSMLNRDTIGSLVEATTRQNQIQYINRTQEIESRNQIMNRFTTGFKSFFNETLGRHIDSWSARRNERIQLERNIEMGVLPIPEITKKEVNSFREILDTMPERMRKEYEKPLRELGRLDVVGGAALRPRSDISGEEIYKATSFLSKKSKDITGILLRKYREGGLDKVFSHLDKITRTPKGLTSRERQVYRESAIEALLGATVSGTRIGDKLRIDIEEKRKEIGRDILRYKKGEFNRSTLEAYANDMKMDSATKEKLLKAFDRKLIDKGAIVGTSNIPDDTLSGDDINDIFTTIGIKEKFINTEDPFSKLDFDFQGKDKIIEAATTMKKFSDVLTSEEFFKNATPSKRVALAQIYALENIEYSETNQKVMDVLRKTYGITPEEVVESRKLFSSQGEESKKSMIEAMQTRRRTILEPKGRSLRPAEVTRIGLLSMQKKAKEAIPLLDLTEEMKKDLEEGNYEKFVEKIDTKKFRAFGVEQAKEYGELYKLFKGVEKTGYKETVQAIQKGDAISLLEAIAKNTSRLIVATVEAATPVQQDIMLKKLGLMIPTRQALS